MSLLLAQVAACSPPADDADRIAAALDRQTEAIERLTDLVGESLRLEHRPALRILVPAPFETRGDAAVVGVAVENEGGPARDVRIAATLVCCTRLESLVLKPEAALVQHFDSAETRAVLPTGGQAEHEVVIADRQNPVREAARQRSAHRLWVRVSVSYAESLGGAGDEAERAAQALTFGWDGSTWQWSVSTADEHRAIDQILEARDGS